MAEHYIIDDKEHVYESAAEKHLTDKTITENGTYSAEDETGDINGYKEVVVDVQSGPSIPIISKADWDALSTNEKKEYGLIIIQTADSGFVRGRYVNGAEYNFIREVQIYGINSGTYEYTSIDDNTTEFTFTNCGSQGGVVLEVLDSIDEVMKLECQLSDVTNTVQYGLCTKTALLPTIITQGSGRTTYTSGPTYTINDFNPKYHNIFMGLYNPGGSYKMRVKITRD